MEAGEIALAYTTTSITDSNTGTVVTHPAILMKVGDGVHKFNETNPDTHQPYLPWISAKAADVVSACKSTTGLTNFIKDAVDKLDFADNATIQALKGRVDTAEGAIDALELLVGTKAVADQIADAVNGLATEKYADDVAKAAADGKDAAIAAAKKAGDDAQKEVDALETYVGTIPTNYNETNVISYINKKAEETLAAAQGGSSETAASVKQQLDDYKSENNTRVKAAEDAIALKADKSVVDAMYTNSQIDSFIAAAKKYADDNDANTTYGIAYDSTNKKINLVAGGTETSIDATDFIKDGMISKVELDANNDLVITFNTDAGADDIKVPLDKLIDTYVGKATDTVNVTVEGREISATVKDGSISESQLSESVNASLGKADSAIQSVATGEDNGTIAVDGADVAVKGLGSAAYKDEDYFDKANAAATAKADVIGKSGDAAGADTIYGAKKYADEKAAEAKKYADDNDANTTYSFNIPTEGNDKGKLVITPSEGKATTLDIATQSELNDALAEAKGYTDDEIAKLDSEVKVTEITDKSGYNVLTGVTQADGKLTSKTELKLSNLAVTASTDDLVQGTLTLLLDCGGSN